MAEFTNPHNIKYPVAADRIKDPKVASKLADDIKAVAETTNDALNTASGRIGELENDLILESGRIDGLVTDLQVESERIDGLVTDLQNESERIDDLEELQPVKSVRLESGKWVWDPSGTPTHYVLLDHDGNPTVRATPWPVPNPSTPSFNW